MKVGSKINLIIFFWVSFFNLSLFAEEKILSTPLINLNKIKPSFDEIDQSNENSSSKVTIKKKDEQFKSRSPHAVLIGLDKITAKSVKLTINLDETNRSLLWIPSNPQIQIQLLFFLKRDYNKILK